MEVVKTSRKKKLVRTPIKSMEPGTFFQGVDTGRLFLKYGPNIYDIMCVDDSSFSWNAGAKDNHPGIVVKITSIEYKV